jgi:hypothetical protein
MNFLGVGEEGEQRPHIQKRVGERETGQLTAHVVQQIQTAVSSHALYSKVILAN